MRVYFAYRKLLAIASVYVLMSTGASMAFAGGAKEEKPTTISMEQQPRQFIAPGNSNATEKNLVLPFKTVTIPGTGKVIKSWEFTIFDSNGKAVYTEAKIETRDRGFFAELFNVGEKPAVEIPADLTWDGTYQIAGGSVNGTLVPDGLYTYQISIVDDTGKRAQTPPFNVTVKNAVPAITRISIPITIFSPTGSRTSIHVDQAGTREQQWIGEFIDTSGKGVRKFSWENATDQQLQDVEPKSFDWDGKDDLGNVVPEGDYFYQLTGKNRAGASVSEKFASPISLSLKAGAVKVTQNSSIFSPNGDGVLDTITFNSEITDTAGLQSWNFSISDSSNASLVRWTKNGTGTVPASFDFDGNDSGGKHVADGKYQAVLSVSYNNGNTVKSAPLIFEVDTTTPKLTLSIDNTVFGGEAKPTVTLHGKAQADTSWTLAVSDKTGKVIQQELVTKPDDFEFVFTAEDKNGKPLPDDLYMFTVSGRDRAGNKGSATVRALKDTRDMSVSVELSQGLLIPKRGTQGIVRITPVLSVVDSIAKMGISVVDASGVDRATKNSKDIITYWDWNGIDNQGKTLPDGSYTVVTVVVYTNGTTSSAQAAVSIDSSIPEIKLSVTPSTNAFTPVKSNVSFGLVASPSIGVKTWKLTVANKSNDVVRTFSGAGSVPASVVWDGRDEQAQITDGAYAAKLLVAYDSGFNGMSDPSSDVIVSSAGPRVDMTLSSKTFVPGNIDGPQTLSISIKPLEGSVPIATWQLTATDERGKIFRKWTGNGSPPATIVWDGKSDTGELVQSGEDYQISLLVQDQLKLETRKTDKVTIDILVIKISDNSYKIVISSIQFGGYSSNIFHTDPNLLAKNIFVLQRLAVVLNKFPAYKIRLEGYAVSEFWDDPKTAEWEQKTQLLPLSTDRATAVRNGLMLLGVDGTRFTVQGFGADRPIVPNGDLENRWKNRRVEFYLDKN